MITVEFTVIWMSLKIFNLYFEKKMFENIGKKCFTFFYNIKNSKFDKSATMIFFCLAQNTCRVL